MEIKTNELIGAALDWAVAQIESGASEDKAEKQWEYFGRLFKPSTNWAHGGPIIEREMIELVPHCYNLWDAMYRNQHIPNDGPTPLVAAMRCRVASKLGDTVDVPEELMK